jgi:hypothetical protein
LFIPEDYAINPLVADPALILFVSKHLPLAAARHVILVADPSLEYQFRLIISHQLAASAVPVDTLGIEVIDLFLLLDLRGLDALSYCLINRKLKNIRLEKYYIFLKVQAYDLVESDFARTDIAWIIVNVLGQLLEQVRFWLAALHAMK